METKNSVDLLIRPSILVVDDIADNLTLMSALLSDTYKIKVANSGAKALKFLHENVKPDLILLDIMIPGLSGYDVLRELKADPITHDIPVIFLTAMSAPEEEKKGLELGAVDYIPKPIDATQLFLTIARWIKPANPQELVVASHNETEELHDFPELEVNNTLIRMGGNVKLLRKLISRFSETQADVVKRIKEALAFDNTEVAQREVHNLKGLAGTIGAKLIEDHAHTIEDMLNSDAIEGRDEAIRNLEIDLINLLSRINDVYGTQEEIFHNSDNKPISVDKDKLAIKLRHFNEQLTDLDSDAATTLIGLNDELSGFEEMKKIQKFVDEFEYEDAQRELLALASVLGIKI